MQVEEKRFEQYSAYLYPGFQYLNKGLTNDDIQLNEVEKLTSPSARFLSSSLFASLSSSILASIWARDSLVKGRNIGRSSSVCK